jgi:hypothetical protein
VVAYLALRRQRRGEGLERLDQLDDRERCRVCSGQQLWQRADVVRAVDNINPRRLLDDLLTILLCQTATDGDGQVRARRPSGVLVVLR